ncbi:MAG: hypothetical protein R3E13_11295 [Alphaproteobacteria bacterium]
MAPNNAAAIAQIDAHIAAIQNGDDGRAAPEPKSATDAPNDQTTQKRQLVQAALSITKRFKALKTGADTTRERITEHTQRLEHINAQLRPLLESENKNKKLRKKIESINSECDRLAENDEQLRSLTTTLSEKLEDTNDRINNLLGLLKTKAADAEIISTAQSHIDGIKEQITELANIKNQINQQLTYKTGILDNIEEQLNAISVPDLTKQVRLKSDISTYPSATDEDLKPQTAPGIFTPFLAFLKKFFTGTKYEPLPLHERIDPILSKPTGPAPETPLPAIFRYPRKAQNPDTAAKPSAPEQTPTQEQTIPNLDVSSGWKTYLEKRNAIDEKVQAAAAIQQQPGTGMWEDIQNWWRNLCNNKSNDKNDPLTQKIRAALEESYRNGSRQRPENSQPNGNQNGPDNTPPPEVITCPQPPHTEPQPEDPQQPESSNQPPEKQPAQNGNENNKENSPSIEKTKKETKDTEIPPPAAAPSEPQTFVQQPIPPSRANAANPQPAHMTGNNVINLNAHGTSVHISANPQSTINQTIRPDGSLNITIGPAFAQTASNENTPGAAPAQPTPEEATTGPTIQPTRTQQRRLPEPPKPGKLALSEYAPTLGATFLKSANINPLAIKGVTEINDENKLVFELKDGQAITVPIDTAQHHFENTRDLAVGINRALDIINRKSAHDTLSEKEMWARRAEFLPAAA